MRALLLILLLISLPKRLYAQSWEKLDLAKDHISSIEKTPWGILIGEYDQRLWKNPFNGIYISKDFGESFEELGLNAKGITDIKHFDNRIYATTFYLEESVGGLFVSYDKGITWEHLGNNFSTTEVEVGEDLILVGTYSHGLWISRDEGQTWEQYFGDGFYGDKITCIEILDEEIFVTANGNTYKSTDSGYNWIEISSLHGKNIKHISRGNNSILASGNGLFRSLEGDVWEENMFFNSFEVGPISFFDNTFYINAKDSESLMYDIYLSVDNGVLWQNLEIPSVYNDGLAYETEWVFSDPSFILTSIPYEGIFKYNIEDTSQTTPFLNIPWNHNSTIELIDNIYSFFDHAFPLLGYSFFDEPEIYRDTTTNFYGITETEPRFYYSSHNGTDFALPFGTPILSSYQGIADYGYDPVGLGHYIKIDHQNGYQTIYAHLQENGLITNQNVWVNEGEQIGLVGMSGKTTGPHLHFEVEKTNIANPQNRIDPFGWKNKFLDDPWEGFFWVDTLGSHLGSKSSNLWKVDTKYEFMANKEVIVEQNASEHNFTIFIEPYSYPKVPITQNKLVYMTGTSMLINAYNMLGQKIPGFLKPAKIEINIANANFDNLLDNSLRIYRWDEEENIWKAIPTTYDALTMTLTGYTKKFSRFAVFGIEEGAWQDNLQVFATKIAISNNY